LRYLILVLLLSGCAQGDSPYLTKDCCIDENCKERDWCGVIKLEKGETVADGDYVRLSTYKEIKGAK